MSLNFFCILTNNFTVIFSTKIDVILKLFVRVKVMNSFFFNQKL